MTAKGGGLKSLLIQDDGCGIGYNDMWIVCERFTTSKLQSFEDLSNMQVWLIKGDWNCQLIVSLIVFFFFFFLLPLRPLVFEEKPLRASVISHTLPSPLELLHKFVHLKVSLWMGV